MSMLKMARLNKARLPNWLLATILTLGWRIDRVRNGLFSEVERRWPAVFVTTWRGMVVVRVK